MKNNNRIIDIIEGEDNGVLLLVTAGVHGNEPSGLEALKKIFSEIKKENSFLKGTFVGVKGNLEALKLGKRFIDEDLNRTWTQEKLAKDTATTNEEKEMQEIVEVLKNFPKQKFPKTHFIDCHSTSSDSLPYISVQEVGKNDSFAHKFPVYIVRGFSDIVNGSIDKYFSMEGLTGFTFEGGQHTSDSTAANHEALIWMALKEICGLELEKMPSYPNCVQVLSEKIPEGQKTFKIIYRHGIEDQDDFKMEPGFSNFQKIEKGELLAIQNGEEFRSKWNATIFMPLYQSQGNDGFFVIEEV